MADTVALYGLVFVALAFILLLRNTRRRAGGSLPPGPKGWPIIGNVLDMPRSYEWLTFSQWSETWGDIIYLKIFRQHTVVINSVEHAVNLLEKRSAIYSDRPSLVLACEILGWSRTLALTPYGGVFRNIRKLFHQYIGSREAVDKVAPLVDVATTKMLGSLLSKPDELIAHLRRTAGSISLMLAYGYETQDENDYLVTLAEQGTEDFALLSSPGAFLVDFFPFLKHVPTWLPFTDWKKKVPAWKKTFADLNTVPFDLVKHQMASGTALPSLTSNSLQEGNLNEEQENVVMWGASSFYAGGADTTVSSMTTFFLAMTCYPEIQKKAQLELDSVVGTDRLPTAADRNDLPYVSALVSEVFRWHPIGPLGVPHRLLKDDIYDGYFLPKGTVVIANIWHMLHDPAVYASPMEFNPDRFITSNGHKTERDPRDAVFGFGRRICPGRFLADASLFMTIAMTLATFDIAPTKDGKPTPEFTSGTISHPKPFRCSIRPRSSKAEGLIRSAQKASEHSTLL